MPTLRKQRVAFLFLVWQIECSPRIHLKVYQHYGIMMHCFPDLEEHPLHLAPLKIGYDQLLPVMGTAALEGFQRLPQ